MTTPAISRARELNSDERIAFDSLAGRLAPTLELLLDMIVPACADRRLPSACDVGVLEYIRVLAPEALTEVAADINSLEHDAHRQHNAGFAAIDPGSRQTLVETLRADNRNFLQRLALETVSCYYQHPRVLAALAIEDRPPFPRGYEVIAGDLTLLEPVRRRGKIYRDA